MYLLKFKIKLLSIICVLLYINYNCVDNIIFMMFYTKRTITIVITI